MNSKYAFCCFRVVFYCLVQSNLNIFLLKHIRIVFQFGTVYSQKGCHKHLNIYFCINISSFFLLERLCRAITAS